MAENAVSDAITASNKCFNSTPTAAAKGIQMSLLYGPNEGYKGWVHEAHENKPSRALNAEQEQAIRNYPLKWLDDAYISATLSMLCGAANYISS